MPPKKGWKKALLEQTAPEAPIEIVEPVPVEQVLSFADKENPAKLTGLALRELAHRKGLAKSSLESMPESKIREQIRYIVQNQYA